MSADLIPASRYLLSRGRRSARIWSRASRKSGLAALLAGAGTGRSAFFRALCRPAGIDADLIPVSRYLPTRGRRSARIWSRHGHKTGLAALLAGASTDWSAFFRALCRPAGIDADLIPVSRYLP